MITATPTANGSLEFKDDIEELKPQEQQLLQAALKAGLTEFTIPREGQFRQNWITRKWLTLRDGKPVCFIVALKADNPHFEVIGPEIALEGKAAKS